MLHTMKACERERGYGDGNRGAKLGAFAAARAAPAQPGVVWGCLGFFGCCLLSPRLHSSDATTRRTKTPSPRRAGPSRPCRAWLQGPTQPPEEGKRLSGEGREPARRGVRDACRPPAGPAQRTGRGGRNRGRKPNETYCGPPRPGTNRHRNLGRNGASRALGQPVARRTARGRKGIRPSEARHSASRRSRHEKEAREAQTVPDPTNTSRTERSTVGGGGVRGPPEGPPHGWRARAKRGQGGSTGAAGAGRAGITRGLGAAPFKASIRALRASG